MVIAEIFVVRLYRRDAGAPGGFMGVVDAIGPGTKHGFGTFDEMLAILRDIHQTRSKPKLSLVHAHSAYVPQVKKEMP